MLEWGLLSIDSDRSNWDDIFKPGISTSKFPWHSLFLFFTYSLSMTVSTNEFFDTQTMVYVLACSAIWSPGLCSNGYLIYINQLSPNQKYYCWAGASMIASQRTQEGGNERHYDWEVWQFRVMLHPLVAHFKLVIK